MENMPLLRNIKPSERILSLRKKILLSERYLSVEQAKIITEVYRKNENQPQALKRSKALGQSLLEIPVLIDPEELIVGNRTPDMRAGIVFPEAGISWLLNEIHFLPERPQDPFKVRPEDAAYFKEHLEPYWRGLTLEDAVYSSYGKEIKEVEKVVKINQKDHAQGHICPHVKDWLRFGPSGLLKRAEKGKQSADNRHKVFYESVCITLDASCKFILRYSDLAQQMAEVQENEVLKRNLEEVAEVCRNLSEHPASNFREALQSVWFLFVILHMESNASSFSPGRMDQYLLPFFERDLASGRISLASALEMIDALYLKFNQIVYMRNSHSARYFAGFPIGFNVTIGGKKKNGRDATNMLSFLFLKAQEHIRLPQPNLTARLHKNSSDEFINECSRVIGLGTGMPQIVNDESIIPALLSAGTEKGDAVDYALVGCVELSSQGNYLGWSDAAMFNLVKVLELTLNNGICMISGRQLGIKTGSLVDYSDFNELENAFKQQIDFFIAKMLDTCAKIEELHQAYMPSPFLSAVVDDCLTKGMDVTAGGAKYNLSGIQAIQVANIADSLATVKKLIYDDEEVAKEDLLKALLSNFAGDEPLRQRCLNHVPKYGNDIKWVDELGAKYITYFSDSISQHKNYRGGRYHMGLYTVSAHVPMGQNVGATPDGRLSRTPLADGGLSPMYGRDKTGPTAVLKSVSRIPSILASNGTLLNMKFLPGFFTSEHDRGKFNSLLRSFIRLPIHHVQFNVVTAEDLIMAKADPESYTDLTIRVAGYTAYFTELSEDLQDEIIARTVHGKEE